MITLLSERRGSMGDMTISWIWLGDITVFLKINMWHKDGGEGGTWVEGYNEQGDTRISYIFFEKH